MDKTSAGIIAFRKKDDNYEVLLVHPGGPFWANKDLNAWSVPKGEPEEGEVLEYAAKREFKEETGFDVPDGLLYLDPVKQPGGKVVYTWAVEADFDETKIESNTIEIEWPPGSGKKKEIPEVDKAGWFPLKEAMQKILKGQIPVLEQLAKKLGINSI